MKNFFPTTGNFKSILGEDKFEKLAKHEYPEIDLSQEAVYVGFDIAKEPVSIPVLIDPILRLKDFLRIHSVKEEYEKGFKERWGNDTIKTKLSQYLPDKFIDIGLIWDKAPSDFTFWNILHRKWRRIVRKENLSW